MALYKSSIASLIVMGASGTIKFNKGEYSTTDKKEIADIESTPSFEYGEIVKVEEAKAEKVKETKETPVKEPVEPTEPTEPAKVEPPKAVEPKE